MVLIVYQIVIIIYAVVGNGKFATIRNFLDKKMSTTGFHSRRQSFLTALPKLSFFKFALWPFVVLLPKFELWNLKLLK